MTSNEFVLWLNGFLDAVSQVEGHHLAKIKNKLKDVNDNPYKIPSRSGSTTTTRGGDIPFTSPFTYNTEGQYLPKEILKG
jgi:hypothetical protein